MFCLWYHCWVGNKVEKKGWVDWKVEEKVGRWRVGFGCAIRWETILLVKMGRIWWPLILQARLINLALYWKCRVYQNTPKVKAYNSAPRLPSCYYLLRSNFHNIVCKFVREPTYALTHFHRISRISRIIQSAVSRIKWNYLDFW